MKSRRLLETFFFDDSEGTEWRVELSEGDVFGKANMRFYSGLDKLWVERDELPKEVVSFAKGVVSRLSG